MQCHINDSRISTATMRTLALVIISAFVFARAVQPLPSSQEEFFDLLPVQFPFPLPSWSLDEVASRLSPACNSLQDLLALAIASSQLHSFNVRSDGSYDLSLPPFDAKLPPTRCTTVAWNLRVYFCPLRWHSVKATIQPSCFVLQVLVLAPWMSTPVSLPLALCVKVFQVNPLGKIQSKLALPFFRYTSGPWLAWVSWLQAFVKP